MASQPQDSADDYRRELERALRAQGLVPPNRSIDRLKTEYDEQLYVIGQLMAKLEGQGVEKGLVTRLLNARFIVEALEPPPEETQAALLSGRDVDETLHRIQQALRSAELEAPPPPSKKILTRDREAFDERAEQDEKRSEFIKRLREAKAAKSKNGGIGS